jgi:hypothetical protein
MSAAIPRTPTADLDIDLIFEAAHRADSDARWTVGLTLLAGVLLGTDDINRERLLRGLKQELREALVDIEEIRRTGHGKMQ